MIPAVKCSVVGFPGAFNPAATIGVVVVFAAEIAIREMKQVRPGAAPWMAGGVEEIKGFVIPVKRTIAIGFARFSFVRRAIRSGESEDAGGTELHDWWIAWARSWPRRAARQ